MSPRAQLELRPIRQEDRAALCGAFNRLSAESRHRRFLSPKPSLSARELDYFTQVDHVTHEAIVAIAPGGQMVGVARYVTWPDRPGVAEVAVTVVDDWHGQGVGTAVVRRLIEHARCNGIGVLTGTTLWNNHPARRLLTRLGFSAAGSDGNLIDFRLEVASAAAAA